MAGLRKAKKYDWKDSNLALFGSDTEKSVRKERGSLPIARTLLWSLFMHAGEEGLCGD